MIKKFVKEHPRLVYGVTTLSLCALSAYGSLRPQDASGQEYKVLIRNLPEELFASGDLLTMIKSGTLAFSMSKFLKTFPEGRSYQAMRYAMLFEGALELMQYPRPDRFFDIIDLMYITLGAFVGSSLDVIVDKFKKN